MGTKKAGGFITYSFKMTHLLKSKGQLMIIIPAVTITRDKMQTRTNEGRIQERRSPAPKVISAPPQKCFMCLTHLPPEKFSCFIKSFLKTFFMINFDFTVKILLFLSVYSEK